MTRTGSLRDCQIKLLVGFSQSGLGDGANIEGVLGSVNVGVHLYVLFAVVTSV